MAAVHLAAHSIGSIAREILTPGTAVEIAAVFERSVYLQLGGSFVCAGVSEIGNGPINLLIDCPAAADFASLGFHRDAKGSVGLDRITFDQGTTIAFATAATWTPPPVPSWSRASITQGLAALRTLAKTGIVDDGLACLVLAPGSPARNSPTAQAAAATLGELAHALPHAMQAEDAAVLARPGVLLLGLGPGLTPSGDDLLGGIMLALSALGHVTLRDNLWAALAPELDDLTNAISAMHLALAADGHGSALMHTALAAILTGDPKTGPADIAAASRIGHTSGWDCLAGIALTLQAWLAAGAQHI